jgi:hypothetical protein
MDGASRAEYLAYKSLSVEAGFPERRLVVYDLSPKGPTNIEVLTLKDLTLPPQGGPVIRVKNEQLSTETPVGVVPTRIGQRDVFLHVPQRFEFKWKGKRVSREGVHFAPHYAVLVKTRNQPRLKVVGHTYCVKLGDFWEMFPGVDIGC